jgi:arginase family enzyme
MLETLLRLLQAHLMLEKTLIAYLPIGTLCSAPLFVPTGYPTDGPDLMKYRLIPTMDVAQLGSKHYIFDRHAEAENLLFVPTQAVSRRLHDVIGKIRSHWPQNEPQDLEAIKALFDDAAEQKAVSTLASAGYLEALPEVTPAQDNNTSEAASEIIQAEPDLAAQLHYFQNNAIKHYFRRPVFFNLPANIDDAEVDVGIVGVPVSSLSVSSGTILSPDCLRQHSQKAGFWFDFHRDGIYSEVGCAGTLPQTWCKDVIAKDFGDVGTDSRTVGALFQDIDALVSTRLVHNGIRGLFVGGDHAVSFPVVNSMIRHYPDLLLIHLDAHNDLFYTEKVEFNHAGPIHGLLLQSGLSKVLSFGLRTNADPRIKPFKALNEALDLKERVEMHSLQATRRLLAQPDAFRAYLAQQTGAADRPVYLTIDLDVLSDTAMSGQLSTPAGHGLEFAELYEFIAAVFDETNVVGCDVVEFNVEGRTETDGADRDVVVLLMQLIDGLARANQRFPLPSNARLEASADRPTNVVSNTETSSATTASRVPRLPRLSVSTSTCAFSEQVPRKSLATLGYDEFLNEHVLPGIPLLLTDYSEDLGKKWSIEYFQEQIDRQTAINVNVFSEPFDHASAQLTRLPLWEALAVLRQRLGTEFSDNDERYNIVDWQFGEDAPQIYNDYQVPAIFNMDLAEHIGFDATALKWIYFGEPGTGSPTHTDVVNSTAWLLLAKGHKRWRMLHADSAPQLLYQHQLADLFNIDPGLYPDTAGLTGYETVQQPGEIIWTPPQCVHAVQNLDHTIALTHNYVDLTNLDAVLADYQPHDGTSLPRLDSLTRTVEAGIEKLREQNLGTFQTQLLARLAPLFERFESNAQTLQASIEGAEALRKFSPR